MLALAAVRDGRYWQRAGGRRRPALVHAESRVD